jgi:ABC-2 type transport system ATP-binding protein
MVTFDSTTPLFSLDHLSRMYGNVIGVNDVHIELPQGAYGLVGPNGAGKSTLIALLTGVLRPSLGSVKVLGAAPYLDPTVQHYIGLCPATDISLPGVTPRQWIGQLLALSGFSPSDARSRMSEVLQHVGLANEIDRPISSFSLGMRQRCKLAQAIANDPMFLILDEPFNGLDPVGRSQMIALLKDWASQGRSLLLASHVLHEVEQVTDSFLFIYGGRLLASGKAGELRSMLVDLPQELTVVSPQFKEFAAFVAGHDWVESIRLDPTHRKVLIAVKRPIEFYQSVAAAVDSGIGVEQLLGADGDMAILFRTLIAQHRGSKLVAKN